MAEGGDRGPGRQGGKETALRRRRCSIGDGAHKVVNAGLRARARADTSVYHDHGQQTTILSGSVSAVIAVWRLALACMGGANDSSLVGSTNPYSTPLQEDVDGGDGG